MFEARSLKKVGMFILILFCWFYLSPSFNFAQEEDELLQARKLYQEGYYDDAITLLNECIHKLKSITAQKKKVAEAFYLLAKVYFTVGEDVRVTEYKKRYLKPIPRLRKMKTIWNSGIGSKKQKRILNPRPG